MNIIWLGISSSFLGALPLGMLNLYLLNLSVSGMIRAALAFGAGAVGVEFFQIFLAISAVKWLNQLPHLTLALTFISVPVLIFLGVKIWRAPYQSVEQNALTMPQKSKSQLVFLKKGAFLSAMNVMVYPFWLLWGNVFFQNGLLETQNYGLVLFSVGACVGTAIAFGVFIFMGKMLRPLLKNSQKWFNQFISIAFLSVAMVQIVKFINSVISF